MENLKRQKFGKLRVIHVGTAVRSRTGRLREWRWVCRCRCGRLTEVRASFLKMGHTQSCGCSRVLQCGNNFRTHGESGKSPEWRAWAQMNRRCYSETAKQYEDYGGRGITVCTRWRSSFVNFLADLGRKPTASHTLERVNNNQNYTPKNCRWATRIEQGRNKRNNRLIRFAGVCLPLSAWAERTSIARGTIAKRLDKLKWPVDRALTTPVNR